VQWKNCINLGKQNNQNFVSIPHARLIQMLEYKAVLAGIEVIIQEESYTSASNFLSLDPIPVYGESDANSVEFTGKRIHRGLYKTAEGLLINGDVNGSYNIMRKALPKALSNGIGSCVVQLKKGQSARSKSEGGET
jgi:transposase